MSEARGRSRAARGTSAHGGSTTTAPTFEEGPEPARTAPVEGARRHLAMAWRRRPTLLAATLAAGLISYTVAHDVRATYETSARVLVGPLGGESKTLQASSQLVRTYAELGSTRSLRLDTARRLRLPPRAIHVRIDVDGVTRFLTIRARDGDPARAAAVANAHAAGLVALSERKGAGHARAGRLQVAERAFPSDHTVSPPAAAVAAVAALAGLLVAFLVALVVERADDAVRSGEDVEAATGAPCVGLLSRAARESPAMLSAEPAAGVADELGALAAKLHGRPGQSLLVIAMHDDATVLAGNLAAALAAQGSRVALVDVGDDVAAGGDDWPDPPHDGVPAVNGTGNGHAPGGAVQRIPRPVLSGTAGPFARRAEAALERLEATADMVVLHASRLERSPTALTWARVADGTVLVAERDRTAEPALRATAETLRMVGAPIVGTVLAEPATALRR
jgi:capsular polysaccharide biosynthesis protein